MCIQQTNVNTHNTHINMFLQPFVLGNICGTRCCWEFCLDMLMIAGFMCFCVWTFLFVSQALNLQIRLSATSLNLHSGKVCREASCPGVASVREVAPCREIARVSHSSPLPPPGLLQSWWLLGIRRARLPGQDDASRQHHIREKRVGPNRCEYECTDLHGVPDSRAKGAWSSRTRRTRFVSHVITTHYTNN